MTACSTVETRPTVRSAPFRTAVWTPANPWSTIFRILSTPERSGYDVTLDPASRDRVVFSSDQATIHMGRTGPMCCIFIVQNNYFVGDMTSEKMFSLRFISQVLNPQFLPATLWVALSAVPISEPVSSHMSNLGLKHPIFTQRITDQTIIMWRNEMLFLWSAALRAEADVASAIDTMSSKLRSERSMMKCVVLLFPFRIVMYNSIADRSWMEKKANGKWVTVLLIL